MIADDLANADLKGELVYVKKRDAPFATKYYADKIVGKVAKIVTAKTVTCPSVSPESKVVNVEDILLELHARIATLESEVKQLKG